MRAILIDPSTKSISEVQATDSTIAELLGCRLFDIVRLGDEDMYVDDEGLLTNPNPLGYFTLPRIDRPFAGRGLLLRSDREGNTIATGLHLMQVQHAVRFIDNPAPESIEPHFEFIAL